MSSVTSIPAFTSGHVRAESVMSLLAAGILLDLLAIMSLLLQIDLISRHMSGQRVTAAEVLVNDSRQQAILSIELLVFIATAILFLLWIHRVHRNLPALGARGMRYSPGWAVASFFIPYASLALPYLVVREIWQATDPDTDTADAAVWKKLPTSPVIKLWWACWLVSGVAGMFVALSASNVTTASQLLVASQTMLAASLVTIPAAVFTIAVVRAIDRRQEERSKRPLVRAPAPESCLRQPCPRFARSKRPFVRAPSPESVSTVSSEPETKSLTGVANPRLESAEDYLQRGVFAYDRNYLDAAIADFNKAVHLKPDYTQAYFYRGLAYYGNNKYARALSDFNKVIALRPNDAEVHFWRGQLFADIGDRPKAIFALENAIRLNPEPELRKEADSLLEQLKRQL
ncbi:MAG TPA: DUF4328 domain-containing protein [Anaerolineae bacterium]|nr:DUF4328 domain-containing protein [Anaerolineae bacterium]